MNCRNALCGLMFCLLTITMISCKTKYPTPEYKGSKSYNERNQVDTSNATDAYNSSEKATMQEVESAGDKDESGGSMNYDRMISALNLSEEQTEKYKAIEEKYATKKKEIISKIATGDQTQLKSELAKMNMSKDMELRSVFTPEQFADFKDMRKAAQGAMGHAKEKHKTSVKEGHDAEYERRQKIERENAARQAERERIKKQAEAKAAEERAKAKEAKPKKEDMGEMVPQRNNRDKKPSTDQAQSSDEAARARMEQEARAKRMQEAREKRKAQMEQARREAGNAANNTTGNQNTGEVKVVPQRRNSDKKPSSTGNNPQRGNVNPNNPGDAKHLDAINQMVNELGLNPTQASEFKVQELAYLKAMKTAQTEGRRGSATALKAAVDKIKGDHLNTLAGILSPTQLSQYKMLLAERGPGRRGQNKGK